MMRRRLVLGRRHGVSVAALGLSGLFALLTSCTSLADFTLGVCGNSVLEADEDCEPGDQNSDPEKPGFCAPKGDASECHYVCRKSACPTGEACGVDEVCRAAGSTFSVAGQPVAANAHGLRVGDFDGDGRADVLLAKDGAIDLHFSTGRALAPPAELPANPGGGLAVGYLNLDIDPANPAAGVKRERADLVVGSGAALAGLLGDPGRKLNVAAASSYTFDKPTRILAAPSHFIPEPELKPDTEREGVILETGPGFSVVVKSTHGALQPLAGPGGGIFPVSVNDLSPAVQLSPLVEGRTTRCDELLFTAQGVDGSAFVAYPCGLNDAPNVVPASISALQIVVPSGITVIGPAIAIDLVKIADGKAGSDGHVDIAIPTSSPSGYGLYVAPGDGSLSYPGVDSNHIVHAVDYCSLGDAFAACQVITSEGLLAAKELNGDSELDFVTHSGVWLSSTLGYYQAASSLLKPWSEAVIADINGDGRPDVVAAPDGNRKGLDVLMNSGASYFNPTILQTANPTGLLTVGDFDGDLLPDVVARAVAPKSGTDCNVPDEIVAYFGRASGGLEEGRVVGRVAGVTQIVSGRLPRLDRRDSISDFGVTSQCGDDSYRISVFYGTGDRLLDAPFLLTDQFGDVDIPDVAPYAPRAIALPSGSLGAAASSEVTVATLATFAGGADRKSAEMAELFIQTSTTTALFNKLAHVVHIPDLTGELADGASLAVANLDADSSAEVALWIPRDRKVESSMPRLYIVDDYDCVPEFSNEVGPCGTVQDASLVSIDLPDTLAGEDVQKVELLVADLDGDKFDDLVLVVVGDTQGQLFFAHNNTPSRKAGDPLFTLTEVSGVTADSATILGTQLGGSGGPSVVFAGTAGGVDGLYSLSFTKGMAGKPLPIAAADGARACDSACDVNTNVGTGDVDGDGLEDIVFRKGESVNVFYRDTVIAGTAAQSKGGAK